MITQEGKEELIKGWIKTVIKTGKHKLNEPAGRLIDNSIFRVDRDSVPRGTT